MLKFFCQLPAKMKFFTANFFLMNNFPELQYNYIFLEMLNVHKWHNEDTNLNISIADQHENNIATARLLCTMRLGTMIPNNTSILPNTYMCQI